MMLVLTPQEDSIDQDVDMSEGKQSRSASDHEMSCEDRESDHVSSEPDSPPPFGILLLLIC
jgi:hypothetical protein